MAECVMAGQADVTILVTAIDEELYTRLQAVADKTGMGVDDIAMLALANYLEEK